MIEFCVKDQLLWCTARKVIFSGDENLDRAHFTFDSSWDEFTKTAVFTRDDIYHVLLDESGVCKIPNEVLADEGTFKVSVFGVFGDVVKTSQVYIYSIKEGARTTATAIPDPTPDAYAQIIELLNNKQNTLIAGNGINISEDNIISAIGGTGTGGVGILSVEQTTTSSEDSGDNIVTVTLTDGTTSTFIVKNGSKGSTGAQGIQGEKGESGYTPIKGIDYFTPTEIKEIEEAAAASIDIPAALPNPYALTFTGAVTGSYDGSQAVTVEIPSGGGGEWETVIDTTFTESAALNTGEMPGTTEMLCVFAVPKGDSAITLAASSAAFGKSLNGFSIASASYGKIGFIYAKKNLRSCNRICGRR